MIVLDTSAAIELLLGLPIARRVHEELEHVEWQVAAPQLLQIEVLQVRRRRVAAGYTSVDDANEARYLMNDVNPRYSVRVGRRGEVECRCRGRRWVG